MNNLQLVDYVKKVHAKGGNTVYILGGIGRKLTNDFINGRIAKGDTLAKNNQAWLRTQIGKYAYDCVGLIKSFMWTNNVPFAPVNYTANLDQNVGMMWNAAKERGQVTNEAHPDIPGLLVMTGDLGHVGVYIGVENGKRAYIEATVTGGTWRVIKSYGYKGKGHTWSRWIKYPYIDYIGVTQPSKPETGKKTVSEVAKEVIRGDWGNGQARKDALTKAGYDYKAVQSEVNKLTSSPSKPTLKSTDEVAREVLDGKWGNGQARKDALTKAGYNYDTIQKRVNELNKPKLKPIDTIAREVIRGDWGNGQARKDALTKAGYDYKAVQKRVNQLL